MQQLHSLIIRETAKGQGQASRSPCVPAKAPRPRKKHMVNPGTWPSSAVYPLQEKPSTSPILSAAAVLWNKRSFDGKTAVSIFWVGLSSHFPHWGQNLPLAPTPFCSLQPHRFCHCQLQVTHLPTTWRPEQVTPGVGTCSRDRHQRQCLSLVLSPEIIILMDSKWY